MKNFKHGLSLMTRTISLIQGQSKFLLFLISDTIPFFINVLIFSILLRKANPHTYGEYIFSISLSVWIFSFIAFGMNYTGVNLVRKNLDSIGYIIKKIIQLRIILCSISVIVLFILSIFSVLRPEISILLSIFAFCQVFQIDFLNIAIEKPNYNSISRFIQGIFMLLAVIFFVNEKSKIEILLAFPIVSFVLGLIPLYYLSRVLILKSQVKIYDIGIKEIFKSGTSISLAQFFQSGYLNMDVIVLGFLSKNTVLIGQYGAFAKLLLTGLIPMGSLLNSFSARISSAFLDKDIIRLSQEIKKMQKISNILGIIGFLIMFFMSKFAIELLSGKPSNIQPSVIFLFSSVYIFYALQLPFFATLPYLNKSKEFFQISFFAFLISVICSLLGFFLFSSAFVVLGIVAYASYLAYSSRKIYNSYVKESETYG
jgi:O-antigen/teichoic acid export membrane protein